MSDDKVHADHNFFINGKLEENLDGWNINDPRKVTHQTGQWKNETVGFMDARNEGTGDQTVTLAAYPRPAPGKADYELRFLYEATQLPTGAVGTLRINPGLGGERDLTLVPSREAEAEAEQDPIALLLDLRLSEYVAPLDLDPAETTVKFTLISPSNGAPGRPGAVRFTFAQLLLVLEALQLDGVTIDGEPQAPGEPLHVCFGGEHVVALQVNVDNAWLNTLAGLLVEGGLVDPENLLTSDPQWGQEHRIGDPWTIFCQPIMEDREIERTLAVRSQYTAAQYPLRMVCGHFWLDVKKVQEATYYPVIDLNQRVDLTVRVQSHFTHMALPDREVTFTLKDTGEVLLKVGTNGDGEAHLPWTPRTEGDWQIEARVASHYHPEDAHFTFDVRVLRHDPWLSARFVLDTGHQDWVWGAQTAYINRGGDHEVTVAFPDGHPLAETELAVNWISSGDTPEGLGITTVPELDTLNPIEGNGLSLHMACKDRRDSIFQFSVRCSKLREPSPLQTLNLAHNSLVINDPEQSTKFPVAGGPTLMLSVQIHSRVPGVGGVSGVTTFWKIGAGSEAELQTGDGGKVEFPFAPVEEGDFEVTVRVGSPYNATDPTHEFRFPVLGEDVWAGIAQVKLGGRGEGSVGLIGFRNAPAVELSIMPVGDGLIGENLRVAFVSEGRSNVEFEVHPPAVIPREMTPAGLTYQVSSASEISSRFQLHVLHDELPTYVLQGRLLSTILQEEGTLKFDDKVLASGDTVYACIGAQHTLKFIPYSFSPSTGLEIGAQLASGDSLGLILGSGDPRPIPSSGLEWPLDARASTESGEQGVLFGLPQAAFTYPPQLLRLGHNRIEIIETRGPTADLLVGETDFLEIKTQSYYTEQAVPGLEISFDDGAVSKLVPTQATGWARFPYTATQPGNFEVKATAPSPYNVTSPFHIFEITVLDTDVVKTDPLDVLPSTTLPEEE